MESVLPYDIGTIYDMTGFPENGSDIDYFAHTHEGAALQVYLTPEHTPSQLSSILSDNYDVFNYLFLKSSNNF